MEAKKHPMKGEKKGLTIWEILQKSLKREGELGLLTRRGMSKRGTCKKGLRCGLKSWGGLRTQVREREGFIEKTKGLKGATGCTKGGNHVRTFDAGRLCCCVYAPDDKKRKRLG